MFYAHVKLPNISRLGFTHSFDNSYNICKVKYVAWFIVIASNHCNFLIIVLNILQILFLWGITVIKFFLLFINFTKPVYLFSWYSGYLQFKLRYNIKNISLGKLASRADFPRPRNLLLIQAFHLSRSTHFLLLLFVALIYIYSLCSRIMSTFNSLICKIESKILHCLISCLFN